MPNGSPLENQKWQRMFDDVLVDPVRRKRLVAALQNGSTADAFKLEVRESGDLFTDHDESALNWLDGREPARMNAFRDMLISAFSNPADVVGLHLAFDYSNQPEPPERVVVTATMSWGLSSCELRFPRPRAQPPQQAPAA